MARCYSDGVSKCHTLIPAIWLVSDARNDAGLEAALARLPRGSGFIFRHYHLSPEQRRSRFRHVAKMARRRGHRVVLSGDARTALGWGADGAYGAADMLTRGPACLRLVTVHSLREMAKARRADALLLSPVHATRSHPGGKVLGPLRFLLMARLARVPVIALGGMNAARSRSLRGHPWAAIDGLTR